MSLAYLVIDEKTNTNCAHLHVDPKQAIKCLCSFDRLDKGWNIISLDSSSTYSIYYANSTIKPKHDIEIRFFNDFPDVIKKKFNQSYNYYRNRYNTSLPEKLILG